MTEAGDARQSSRDRILIAAATMVSENPAERPSVRAVATRAGVSTGSLRHHFPTQRALMDAVLAGIYAHIAPGEPIHDTALPARERLVSCLRQILAHAGTGNEAREALRRTYETLIAPEPTEEARRTYLVIEGQMQHRVEHWLSVLVEEGALTGGDNARRAKFLLTVVNGVTLERALPGTESLLESEAATLFAAVDSVLGGCV